MTNKAAGDGGGRGGLVWKIARRFACTVAFVGWVSVAVGCLAKGDNLALAVIAWPMVQVVVVVVVTVCSNRCCSPRARQTGRVELPLLTRGVMLFLRLVAATGTWSTLYSHCPHLN